MIVTDDNLLHADVPKQGILHEGFRRDPGEFVCERDNDNYVDIELTEYLALFGEGREEPDIFLAFPPENLDLIVLKLDAPGSQTC